MGVKLYRREDGKIIHQTFQTQHHKNYLKEGWYLDVSDVPIEKKPVPKIDYKTPKVNYDNENRTY